MAIEVFNRYENKYFVPADKLNRVLDIIEEKMEPDKFNKDRKTYSICNIYFDTADDYLIRTSLQKPKYKEKLRLRSYGVPAPDATVFLEIKKKVNGLVNKRRTKIGLRDAFSFVENGGKVVYSDIMNPKVLSELSQFVQRYPLIPRVYIAYDRLAYFEKGNPDLRLSLDTNIRTRRYDLRPEMGDYGKALLPADVWLMEIKTRKGMPMWLADMLTSEGLQKVSFSKYGTEYKNFVKSGGYAKEQLEKDAAAEKLTFAAV